VYIALYRELSPITGFTVLENPANVETMMCKAKEYMGRVGSGVPQTVLLLLLLLLLLFNCDWVDTWWQ
jgi:hypothetical protein